MPRLKLWETGWPAAAPPSSRSLAIGILALEILILLGRVFGMIRPLGPIGSFFSVIGCLVIAIAATTGIGALILTRFRSRIPEPDEESVDLPLGEGPERAATP